MAFWKKITRWYGFSREEMRQIHPCMERMQRHQYCMVSWLLTVVLLLVCLASLLLDPLRMASGLYVFFFVLCGLFCAVQYTPLFRTIPVLYWLHMLMCMAFCYSIASSLAYGDSISLAFVICLLLFPLVIAGDFFLSAVVLCVASCVGAVLFVAYKPYDLAIFDVVHILLFLLLSLYLHYDVARLKIGSLLDAEHKDAAIAALELARQQLRLAAETDELSGLFNRRKIVEFTDSKAAAPCAGCGLVLGLLDLDNFKQINDQYGHRTGDKAVRGVGQLLGASLRQGDAAARIGGDEFVFVLRGVSDEAAAKHTAERLLCDLQRLGADMGLPLSASLGLACAPRDGVNFDALYAVADAAMYAMKQAGKNRVGMAAEGVQPV